MVINGQQLFDAAPLNPKRMAKFKEHGVSFGLSEAGYDIRVKQNVAFWGRENLPIQTFTWEGGDIHSHKKSGRFTIASTIEEFDMPNDLVGIVHDKSTWARQGLSVFNTVIEPGWKGFLTLELVYHGSDTLFIPAGAGIAQVIFHRIAEPNAYAGKYQNQEDRPVEAIAS